MRRNARYGTIVSAKDHTGDVGTMPAGRAEVGGRRHQSFSPHKVGVVQARMGEINRPVQHGDADRRIAHGLGPEFSDSGEEAHDYAGLAQMVQPRTAVATPRVNPNLQRGDCKIFPPKKIVTAATSGVASTRQLRL